MQSNAPSPVRWGVLSTAIDQYRLEVEHFASCVRSGQQPALRLEETLENMATIEAIYRSAGHPWPLPSKRGG